MSVYLCRPTIFQDLFFDGDGYTERNFKTFFFFYKVSEVSTRTNLQDLFLDMGMDKGILKQGMKVFSKLPGLRG